MTTKNHKLQIGRHWSITGGTIADSIRRAVLVNINAIQIYLGGNQNKTVRNISEDEAKEIRGLRTKYKLYVVVHGKLIYNFCASGRKWQLDLLESELREAAKMKADVVIHQGKNVNKLNNKDAQLLFVKQLEDVLDNTSDLQNRILLENSAHQGTEIGYSIQELGEIYSLFKKKYRKRIGFCLDTCHIFVAGEMDLRFASSVKSKLNDFDKYIGLSKLKLIHLNDSNAMFDSHVDRHGSIMVGHIGSSKLSGSLDGLKEIVKYSKKNAIPVILETPKTHPNVIDEIRFVESWVSKKNITDDTYNSKYKTHNTLCIDILQKKKIKKQKKNKKTEEK